MRVRATLPILAAAVGAALACYPDQMVTSVTQLASVSTLVDSQAPLKAAQTFALPDTIVHPTGSTGSGAIGHTNDALILGEIRDKFVALGWRQITNVPAETPDVIVLTAVLEESNTGYAYGGWWGNWGWYSGWPVGYGPDWAWGYPANAVTFTYETGTLLLVMLDTRHGNTSTKRVPILWAAAVSGVLTASSLEGALAGLDQAFAQSPYLQRQ